MSESNDNLSPWLDDGDVKLYQGDAATTLRALPAGIAHTCVTSPPYFGLRDYGTGDAQIGLEQTPGEYVDRLVDTFRAVRHVLRDDGTLWLNLGDSYAGSWGNQGRKGGGGTQRAKTRPSMQRFDAGKEAVHDPACNMDDECDCGATEASRYPSKESNTGAVPDGWKPKDLMGMPWRVALALQADGWYLRSDIIWHKPNPMPESITDRPTKAHEYVFLLAKSQRYYYDHAAIKEPSGHPHLAGKSQKVNYADASALRNDGDRVVIRTDDRNKRSVWTVATQPYAGAHFAVFPPALIEPCILAGAPEGGVVLDPFMGSGTTAHTARRLNRKAIGTELNVDYLALAAKRLEQQSLFGDEGDRVA